ncbi:hypothetical protein FP66_04510 [Halomonas salina]|uniref:Uncharacterized protein n=1 Tax=Halomonas salina TaxID=42565 RepID=A0ABR4WU82_9GAMM|nr:hypothetical protein FP66_04510 [Halomonas salina]
MMPRYVTGPLSLCLMLLLTGCALCQTQTVPVLVTPMVPPSLTSPLPAPAGTVETNRGLLNLLADYEALRLRANQDRAAVVEILGHDAGDEE